MSNSINSNVNRVLDSNGDPVSGAKLYAYDTGTTTPQTIYTDKALSTPTAVPHVADSEGVFALIYSANTTDLKIVVKDASDVTLYTLDPAVVFSTGGGASTIAFTPTSRISDTNVQAAIEKVDGFVEQLEKDTSNVYATAGSVNAYTVAITELTEYASGDVYTIRADRDNTGAATLNFQSVGAKSWQYYDSSGALTDYASGEIVDGTEFKVRYDGTQFVTIVHRISPATTTEMTAGTAGRFPDAAKVNAANGWVFIDNNLLTVDASTIEITGIGSDYSRWKCLFAVVLVNSTVNFTIEARTAAGTWRLIAGVAYTTAGAGDPVYGWFEVDNVNDADGTTFKMCVGGSQTAGAAYDRTTGSLAATGGSSEPLFGQSSYASEVWDEIRLSTSAGNFEGSTAAQASELKLWGHL